MISFAGTLILASIIAHALLLIFVQAQAARLRAGRWWLTLAILCSLLSTATYIIPQLSGYTVVLAQTILIFSYGALTIQDVTHRVPRLWLIGCAIWFVALLAGGALGDPSAFSHAGWLVNVFSAPTILPVVALLGFLIAALALLSIIFYAFYKAILPEVANRALFWLIDTAILLTAAVLIISGDQMLLVLGQPIAVIGLAGAAYAQVSYRVVDIRGQFGSALRTFILLLLTAAVIFITLLAADSLKAPTPAIFAGLALLAALIYAPLRRLSESLIDLITRGSLTSPTEITRRYSQQISGALELSMLVESATQAMNSLMRVRRSALILVSESSDPLVELRMLPGESKPGYISKDGLLYQQFAQNESCLSQFDLEFNPTYKVVAENESSYLRETQMSVYAPIVYENALIGILACGAKTSDATFTTRDFEVLATLAHQTSAALRNARLVADLRKLNTGMQALNQSLENAREQMERLDSVKTDFITIASHELRTPLAQVRGYTDIIDTLNEQGMLEPEQMAGMVGNLRKASERMEELIGAMLDVSQLDVNAMDLRFAQTTLDSVVRMAIEPLTDAIKQRKLTLSARGLRGLPPIEADMQRLVQAFRNVVVNAIKFTPDGGRIEIKASLQPAERPGEQDHLLVAISDTGVGIEKDNLELIFRKFYRTYDPSLHSTGAYKFMGAGPGLGLTIAQGVIDGHGGKIWAESPGHSMDNCPGTTFYVLLPVTPPEDARRVMPFQMPEPVSQEPTLMRIRTKV